MLRFMERATICYLKQKGWSNVQIAEFTGHHRDTIVWFSDIGTNQSTPPRDICRLLFMPLSIDP